MTRSIALSDGAGTVLATVWSCGASLTAVLYLLLAAPGSAVAQPVSPAADRTPIGSIGPSNPALVSKCDASCVKATLDQASAACARQIEARAPIDFDWLNRPFTGVFQEAEQSSPTSSVVRYRGDSIRFLSPQKEWVRIRYECLFDAASQSVFSVDVRPGRLGSAPAVTAEVPPLPGKIPPRIKPANVAVSKPHIDEPSAIEVSQIAPAAKR